VTSAICIIDQKTQLQDDDGWVCQRCRRREHRRLADIGRWWAQLAEVDLIPDAAGEEIRDEADRPVYVTPDRFRADRAYPLQPTRLLHRDPVAETVPAGITRGRSDAPRVTGSRNPPLPMPIDPVDLTLPASDLAADERPIKPALVPATAVVPVVGERRWIEIVDGEPQYRSETIRAMARGYLFGPAGQPLYVAARDQVGVQPAAVVLDFWVRDWRDTLTAGDRLPVPTVPHLVAWLRTRLDVALDTHPAIDEYSGEVNRLWLALRAAVGENAPEPERITGVPCKNPECDADALFRTNDGSGYVECGACGRLLTAEDYQEWVGLVAGSARQRKTREAAA